MNYRILQGLAQLGHTCVALAPITPEGAREYAARCEPLLSFAVERYTVPHYAFVKDVLTSTEYRRLECDQIRTILPRLISHAPPDLVVLGRESFCRYAQVSKVQDMCPVVLIAHADPGYCLSGLDETAAGHLLGDLNQLDSVIAVGVSQGHSWIRKGLCNVRTIPNVVDPQVFTPTPKNRALLRALRLGDDDIVVLHVSNLKPEKRVGDLIESAKIVLAQNGRAVYVIVGDGPDRQALETATEQHRIAHRFRFVGWIEHDRIVDYLNIADLVVMPSEAEARSLTFMEAQACGKLLLASDIPAARELIKDGETGMLARLGDVEELAAKTLRAVDAPALRASIGARARTESQSRSVSAMLESYATAFAEVTMDWVTRKNNARRGGS